MEKEKLVFLTGAGMSVESGFKTFRGNDGLWENYPVEQVASHEGWEADPVLVTNFYNMLRKKLWAAKPNKGHELIHKLEEKYRVTVITQNVDNLHEKAGSTHVIHLHGDLTKVCSSRDPYNPSYIEQLDEAHSDVKPGTPIYLIDPEEVMTGQYKNVQHIKKGASAGMEELFDKLTK